MANGLRCVVGASQSTRLHSLLIFLLAYHNLWFGPPPLVITTNDTKLHECTRMFDCQSDGIWTKVAAAAAKLNTKQTKGGTKNRMHNFNGGFMHNFFHCKNYLLLSAFSFFFRRRRCSLTPTCFTNNFVAFVLISPFIYFSLCVHVIQMIRETVLPAPLVLSRCVHWILFVFSISLFRCVTAEIYCYPLTYKHTFSAGKHTVYESSRCLATIWIQHRRSKKKNTNRRNEKQIETATAKREMIHNRQQTYYKI